MDEKTVFSDINREYERMKEVIDSLDKPSGFNRQNNSLAIIKLVGNTLKMLKIRDMKVHNPDMTGKFLDAIIAFNEKAKNNGHAGTVKSYMLLQKLRMEMMGLKDNPHSIYENPAIFN
jgi:hypothetical protein